MLLAASPAAAQFSQFSAQADYQFGMASRCLAATSGGYVSLNWLASCPLSASGLPNSTSMPGCCAAISASIGLKNGTGAAAGCFCEAETAAASIFILSSVGNAPLNLSNPTSGSAGLPLTGTNGILAQCNTLYGYTDIFWPSGNLSYQWDCSNVDEYRMATTSDYNYIPTYNSSEGLVIPTKLQNSVRIPYVMNLTSSSSVIRWRTAAFSTSNACYITNMTLYAINATLGQATQTCVSTDIVVGTKNAVDHAVLLSGLSAGTMYYYWAGAKTSASTYSLGTFFKTAPSNFSAPTNVRFWLHGDYGSTSGGQYVTTALDGGRQAGVLNGFLAYETATQRTADAWLSLGDTVYNTGSDPLFQYNFFNIYGASAASATAASAYGTSPIGRMPVWPAIGNHDTYSWSYLPSMQPSTNTAPLYNFPWVAPSGTDKYVKNSTGYGIAFGSSLPQNGEALNGGPGVSSGTWRYYSFNYGRVHVVVLDSMTTRSNSSMPWDPTIGTSYNAPGSYLSSLNTPAFTALYNGAGQPNQMEWLAADLASVTTTTTDFIVAVYHHPAYSWGSHNSDKEVEMIEMRTLYNPILEAGGVDICFHGHSHGYERMLPTFGFTGSSSTFNATAMVPSTATNYYTSSPGGIAPSIHTKPVGITANGGTSYVVAGSGGQFQSVSSPSSGSASYRFPSAASPAGVSDNTGSLVMDINGTTLTLTFVAGGAGTMAQGQIGDVFMICKGGCPTTPASTLTPPPKTGDTIVYASFGDWGWGVGGNNSLLQDATAASCMTLGSAAYAASCIGNQGHYTNVGYAQISQKAVANAIGAACLAYGGCDFLMNTGDSFYDLGITGGVTDPQWANAYLNVYTHPALASTPILSTLGNHDYSILSPTAAAAQIAYTAVDPTHRWYLPAHNYQRFFTSASGATTLQVVEVDSTPLHDRYLYSGGSGGGFATGVSGVADSLVNNPAGNIVINPGVNAANGFAGNLFNDSNYQCYYSFKPTPASLISPYIPYASYQGASKPSSGNPTIYDWTGTSTGWANAPTSGIFGTASSGCKYASPEMAPFATPAARAAAWTNVSNWFSAGATAAQHQVMFSHFPVLSTQQRMTPYYDNALSMWQSLGAAAPSAYYNGHDHIMALVQNSGFQTAGGLTVPFITTGAAGISDYSGPTSVPAAGYAAGSAAATQAQVSYPLSQQPTSGTKASAKYNPDVGSTTFWSNYNGFTMTTVNTTTMKIEFYLVNCTLQAFGLPCSQALIGPLSTVYMPAKTPSIAAVPAGAPVVTASLTLAGILPAQFVGITQAAFISTVATTLAVPSTSVVITSVTASSRRRLLAAGSTVTFSVVTANAAALSTTMNTAFGTNSAAFVTALNANLASVGSSASCSSVTVAAAPAASTYGGAASAAVRSSGVAAVLAALVALAALAL